MIWIVVILVGIFLLSFLLTLLDKKDNGFDLNKDFDLKDKMKL